MANIMPEEAKSFSRKFGYYMKNRRAKFGYTLDDLMKLTGIHKATLSEYERGTIRISLFNAIKLSGILFFDFDKVAHERLGKGDQNNG